jgi:hypothetical protein
MNGVLTAVGGATPIDAGSIVTSGLNEVSSVIPEVAGPAFLVGAAVVALGLGWRIVKRFVKG